MTTWRDVVNRSGVHPQVYLVRRDAPVPADLHEPLQKYGLVTLHARAMFSMIHTATALPGGALLTIKPVGFPASTILSSGDRVISNLSLRSLLRILSTPGPLRPIGGEQRVPSVEELDAELVRFSGKSSEELVARTLRWLFVSTSEALIEAIDQEGDSFGQSWDSTPALSADALDWAVVDAKRAGERWHVGPEDLQSSDATRAAVGPVDEAPA